MCGGFGWDLECVELSGWVMGYGFLGGVHLGCYGPGRGLGKGSGKGEYLRLGWGCFDVEKSYVFNLLSFSRSDVFFSCHYFVER